MGRPGPSIRRTPPNPTLSSSALAFALALCLPYANASPLPTSTSSHRATPLDHVWDLGTAAKDVLLLRTVGSLAAANITTPYRTFIRPNAEGLYVLPQGYVRLRPRYNGGFIVLSYLIAFIGSLCTLELLVRRTTNTGWRNQVLLTAAGVTFGSVSTFAMHFIFNNSLSLHHPVFDRKGYPAVRLSYNAGYTVLSLVASCLAMTLAFFVMGTNMRSWWWAPCFGKHHNPSRHARDSAYRDEYGRWKDVNKKVMGFRAGILSLFGRVGSSWSTMEDADEKMPRRDSKMYDGSATDEVSKAIRSDKELQELDFRLGRDAVKEELARRSAASSPSSNSDVEEAGHLEEKSPSVISEPFNGRQASPPTAASRDPNVFVPGYSFPAKPAHLDFSSSATQLVASAPNSANSSSSNSWPDHAGEEKGRRASLPVSSLVTRSELGPRTRTLSRIQSFNEGELDRYQASSDNGGNVTAQTSIASTEDRLVQDATVSEPVMARQRHIRVFSAIERFLGFDVVTLTDIIKIVITGTIAGFGVAAMHYIGQLSITGMPYIAYRPEYVVGSVIIASGAVVIALYIMFIMLRPKLKHTWLSKIAVAIILAVAVCAMHFCGMRGTVYGWPRNTGITKQNLLAGTNRAITAVVACLAFVACIACGIFLVLHSLQLRKGRARRRRVVVASVLMDMHDRVLVSSTDGTLPMCDIANLTGQGSRHDSRKSFPLHLTHSSDSTVLGMDLTTGHTAFVNALKMSWGWSDPALAQANGMTYTPALPSEMGSDAGNKELAPSELEGRQGSVTTLDSAQESIRQMRLSASKFLERFAQSSSQLAVQLVGQKEGISRLGVLYDQILTTGWVRVNNSNDTVSKGQLIFLVRRVMSHAERSDLLAKHYIFADSSAVALTLHKTLSVPLDHTEPLLADMRTFCDSTARPLIRPNTLYAGLAIVQATPFDGLRILLDKDNRSQLPLRELCTFSSTSTNPGEVLCGTVEELGEAISWLDGLSLLTIITRNMSSEIESPGGPRVASLLLALERAIVPMLDSMLDDAEMEHIIPRLHLHPVLVPLTPGSPRKRNKPTAFTPPYAIIFYANYDAAVNTFTDKWLPFNLFRAQNSCAMARTIAAASKADVIQRSESESSAGDEAPPTRRPSKVMFEIPDTITQGSALHTPLQTSGPPGAPVAAGMFNGFAFPSRADDSSDGGSSRPTSPNLSTPISAAAVAKRTLGAGRRSSLATRSRHFEPHEKGDVLQGVAAWDPDWLLLLLRGNLTVDA